MLKYIWCDFTETTSIALRNRQINCSRTLRNVNNNKSNNNCNDTNDNRNNNKSNSSNDTNKNDNDEDKKSNNSNNNNNRNRNNNKNDNNNRKNIRISFIKYVQADEAIRIKGTRYATLMLKKTAKRREANS